MNRGLDTFEAGVDGAYLDASSDLQTLVDDLVHAADHGNPQDFLRDYFAHQIARYAACARVISANDGNDITKEVAAADGQCSGNQSGLVGPSGLASATLHPNGEVRP